MNVKLVSTSTGAGEFIGKTAEEIIVYCARVSSSKSVNEKFKDPDRLLNYLIRKKHWSPFEMAQMTLEIQTSRAIGTQILRHRSFSFQEFSQRYAAVAEIEPVELRREHDVNRQSSTDIITDDQINDSVAAFLRASHRNYEALLQKGVARESARMILPLASSTTIFMSGNIRSWLGFLNVRLDEHAQKEAREIAKLCGRILETQFPAVAKGTNRFGMYEGMFM